MAKAKKRTQAMNCALPHKTSVCTYWGGGQFNPQKILVHIIVAEPIVDFLLPQNFGTFDRQKMSRLIFSFHMENVWERNWDLKK